MNGHRKCARETGFRHVAAVGALLVATFGFPSRAAAQPVGFEVRAGVTASTALAEDAVANSELRQLLGAGFDGGVKARPAPGTTLAAAVLVPLRPRTTLDVTIGWTLSRLKAEDASGSRDLQSMNIVQLGVGIRYHLRPGIDAGCGFGAARYSGDEAGLFASGASIAPSLECGGGVHVGAAGQRFVVRAFAQAQRFRTPALRDAGAQTGSVFRFGAQAGVVLGGGR